MIVRYAHLCDHCLISKELKPCIIGIFSKIFASGFPFVMEQSVQIFICIALELDDLGKTNVVETTLYDPDMVPLMRIDTVAQLDTNQPLGDVHLNWMMQRLQFEKAGPHILTISCGGKSLGLIEFAVELRGDIG